MNEKLNIDCPTVSIIIPAFNSQETLGQCLQSIQELNYPPDKIETIIVDNGSSDATPAIAKQYNARVLYYPYLKVGALRNMGAKIAQGEIIAFTDSDCVLSKGWLKEAVLKLSDNRVQNTFQGKLLGIITGKIDIPDNSTWVQRTWSMSRMGRKTYKIVDWASSMNMVIKKSIFNEIGGFSEELITCEDVDLSSRVIKKGYSILYAEEMMMIHLGEAKDLARLLKKEFWRGKGEVKMLLRNKDSWTVWLHFLQILWFAVLTVAIFLAILFSSFYLFTFSVIGLLLPPLLRSLKISLTSGNMANIFKLMIVWQIYYFARTGSFFYSIKEIIMNSMFKR